MNKKRTFLKFLIYTIFFITCTAGIYLGLGLIQLAYNNVLQAGSTADIENMVSERYKSEIDSTAADQVRAKLADLDLYSSEYDEAQDYNEDGTVDIEDIVQIISASDTAENAKYPNLSTEYDGYDVDIYLAYGNTPTPFYVYSNHLSTYGRKSKLQYFNVANLGHMYDEIYLPEKTVYSFDTFEEMNSFRRSYIDTGYNVDIILPDEVKDIALNRYYLLDDETAYDDDGTAYDDDMTAYIYFSNGDGDHTPYNYYKQYSYEETDTTEDAVSEREKYPYPTITDGYKVVLEDEDGIAVKLYLESSVSINDMYKISGYGEFLTAMVQIYPYRYTAVIIFIILSILFVVSMVVSMVLSGSREGLRPYEKIPLELMLCAIAGLVACIVVPGCEMLKIALYTIRGDTFSTMFLSPDLNWDKISNVLFVLAISSSCTAGLLIFNNLIARAKQRKFFSTSLIVRLFKKLFGRESTIVKWVRYVAEKIPFIWKAAIVYLLLTIGEIILLAIGASGYGVMLFFFVIFKCIFIILFITFICMMAELFKGGDKLAQGDYKHKVNTKYMFWAFKKHGENLNNINEGIQVAVEERMKSERMKTELITNVSHDIKTPLTSIINYVDLLEKENITGEPEASYIEVLARQSARLKKLIEDLVEASKASTGNVQVELTHMDINMLIDQAAAEYVDKLADKNIQLVVSKSDLAAYAMADGRHLWRVFDNLLNNACKYAMPGTRVYVTTSVVDTQGNKISDINNIDVRNVYVKIEFKNISKEPLNISSDELMERFVRGDSSRNTEGSGLGLSISRSLCQLQSAYFDVSIDGDLYKAIITFPYAPQNNTAYSMIVADEEV
jgi:signal transduction histidine kinase